MRRAVSLPLALTPQHEVRYLIKPGDEAPLEDLTWAHRHATLIDAAPPGLASGVDRLPVTAAIHHLLGEVPFPCQIEK